MEILGVSILAFLASLIIVIFLLTALVLTLIRMGKKRQWGWFTTTLILSILFGLGILMMVIYWVWVLISKK